LGFLTDLEKRIRVKIVIDNVAMAEGDFESKGVIAIHRIVAEILHFD
jgi:hypothetical protein